MRREGNKTFWRGAMVLVAGAFALTVLAIGETALAGGDEDYKDGGKKITISGIGTLPPEGSKCGAEAPLAQKMAGDLKGCLEVFPTRSTCEELNGFAFYREWGRELFRGTLHGKWGKFETRYVFDAVFPRCFDEYLPDGPELAGGCDHKIWGTSGVFKNVEGLITFLDVLLDEPPYFPYSGYLVFEDDWDHDHSHKRDYGGH